MLLCQVLRWKSPLPDSLSMEEIQSLMGASPFIVSFGMRLESVDHGNQRIRMSMPLRRELHRGEEGRQFHGGAIASLIDTAACLALLAVTGGPIASVSLSTEYLRPAADHDLSATATVRRVGRQFGVVDVDVHCGEGRLVAIGRATISCARG